MMLPPLYSLPRDGFVCFIAAEACLTASRHLGTTQPKASSDDDIVTHDSELTRIVSMNCFASRFSMRAKGAIPALGDMSIGGRTESDTAYICEEDIQAALIVEGFLAQASDGILVSCVRLLYGNLGGNS